MSMHWFSSDAFLGGLAAVYFPGRPTRIAIHRAGGRSFRLLSTDRKQPVLEWPFLDFLVPLEGTPAVTGTEVRFAPRTAVDTVEISGKPEIAPGTDCAPFISWPRFADWAAFEKHFASRRSSLPRDSRQKRRNLEKDLGPVVFRWEDPRPEVYERCVAWKSAQYDRTGVVDLFRDPRNVEFFRTLHAAGSVVVSSLTAGDTLLAVHLGALSDDGVYSWIAAYDPERGRYSPGRLLLEDMLRESQARAHREWDFGIGDMEYKWHYATHNRVIGPAGAVPVRTALANAARVGVKRALTRYPRLLDQMRRVLKRVKEAPLG
jgi:hypothetical protein